MGKRSKFKRRPQDAYDTPPEAVLPLQAHLPLAFRYWEPCAGEGALIGPIGRACRPTDIEPRDPCVTQADALKTHVDMLPNAVDLIITNPHFFLYKNLIFNFFSLFEFFFLPPSTTPIIFTKNIFLLV